MHFVPQTYLKRFAREIKKGNKSVFLINSLNTHTLNIKEIDIRDVCYEKNLYRLEGDRPEERQFIELMYRLLFEDGYNSLYSKLSNEHEIYLTPEERDNVIGFVVSMFYRNTVWNRIHDQLSNEILDRAFYHKERTGIDVFVKDGQEISIANMTLDEAKKKDKVQTRQLSAVIAPEKIFQLTQLRRTTDIISVHKLPDGFEFVTSDHPVLPTNKEGVHLIPMDPTNTLYLPIDTKHLLCLTHCKDFTGIDKNMIGRMPANNLLAKVYTNMNNKGHLHYTERWIFGSDNELKKFKPI